MQRILICFSVFIVLGSLAILTSCVSQKDGDLMQQDIIALRTQLESLKQTSESKAGQLEEKQSEIAKNLDKTMHHNQLTTANDHVELNRIKRDMLMLNGMIEKNDFNISQAKIDLEKHLQDLETRISVIEVKLGINPAKNSKPAPNATVVEPPKPVEEPDDANKLYKLAKSTVIEGKTVEGRRLLAVFLKKFPEDGNADNAQYWIGESYFKEKKYHQAVMEFQKVSDKHPKSDAADDAAFMLGQCFERLGMKEDARLFYEDTIARFPKTNSAQKAQSALKRLK